MTTKQVGANTLQKGSYILIEGTACKVVDTQTSKPGKHGHSKIKISAIGILDDKKRVIVLPGHDNVEVPIIEKKNAQVLSIHENTANVMDNESYETFDLEIPEELKADIAEGANILYWTILDQKVMKQVTGKG